MLRVFNLKLPIFQRRNFEQILYCQKFCCFKNVAKNLKPNKAGERGADVIYNGQYDVLKDTEDGELIKVKIQFYKLLSDYLLAHVGAGENSPGHI